MAKDRPSDFSSIQVVFQLVIQMTHERLGDGSDDFSDDIRYCDILCNSAWTYLINYVRTILPCSLIFSPSLPMSLEEMYHLNGHSSLADTIGVPHPPPFCCSCNHDFFGGSYVHISSDCPCTPSGGVSGDRLNATVIYMNVTIHINL